MFPVYISKIRFPVYIFKAMLLNFLNMKISKNEYKAFVTIITTLCKTIILKGFVKQQGCLSRKGEALEDQAPPCGKANLTVMIASHNCPFVLPIFTSKML